MLALLLPGACSTDPEPTAGGTGAAAMRDAGNQPERPANPMPTLPVDRSVAGRLLAGNVNVTELQLSAEIAKTTVREIIDRALANDGALAGRAPDAIAQLGPTAVPGLLAELTDEDPRHRRIAALTFLSLANTLHELGPTANAELAAALAAAREDTDPIVATAAKHALRRLG